MPPTAPAFSLIYCPIPPTRARRALFPSGEGGDQGYFMQGASPLASPGLNPGGTGTGEANHSSGGVCLRNRQLAAKPIEQLFYWQCRQPRRGGTGGEELRRLRWSSPPGQGEQVSLGFSPPAGHGICFLLRCLKINPVAVAFFEKPLAFLRKIWYNTIQSCTVACSCARKPARV